jgi:amidase
MYISTLEIVLFELTNKIHEFNDVIKEFCDGFENPKIRTSGDIIKYNVEHAETAIPERKSSGYDAEAANRSPYAAHPNQKDLIDSHNSPLSAEEAARAYREINRKARRDGMEKYMKDNDVDLIVASSDCTLVIWAADAGK